MNYYNEIKNILVDNAIGRKVREYKSNQKDLESYYNVGKLLVEAQGGEKRAKRLPEIRQVDSDGRGHSDCPGGRHPFDDQRRQGKKEGQCRKKGRNGKNREISGKGYC